MISSLSASHMQFICSFLLAAAFHFLRWRKTPSHRNLGFQPPFMRTWATASGPPLDELPAKNRFGKNFPHSEISESWRGVQKTTKRMGKKRKGKARLTKNTPEKHDLRAKTTVTQIVATSHHAAMVRSNRRGDSRAPGTGAGRAGGMGTGRGCERRSIRDGGQSAGRELATQDCPILYYNNIHLSMAIQRSVSITPTEAYSIFVVPFFGRR